MIVTATELASDSKSVVDRVLAGESAEVVRHGRTVAQMTRQAGVGRAELLRILGKVNFTAEESRELKRVMDQSAKVFGHAGRD
jgi:antitoxin (DNA-binding transcriptional repressor) of toxin-antitoxin stability system